MPSPGIAPHQLAWLFLSGISQLGPITLNRLYRELGSAEAILATSRTRLSALGLRPTLLQRIDQWPHWRDGSECQSLLERLDRWQGASGGCLLTLECSDYPPLLKQLEDPPVILYVRGDPSVLCLPQVAMVGSRNASVYGQQAAFSFARQLSTQGLLVTSGLALGIDGYAHQGALQGLGLTVAVLGTGVDRLYPRRHQDLAARILEAGGAIISEYPLGTAPRGQNFPRRNRIISGLSLATLVVEASPASGSLITARQALEQGREVFAIPGSIHNPLSKGCHQLIRQGAKLVEAVEHIFEELMPQLDPANHGALFREVPPEPSVPATALVNEDENRLLQELGDEPVSMDLLIHRTGLSAQVLMGLLMELEIRGLVASQGGCYQRDYRGV